MVRVIRVEFSVHSHATEDEHKVIQALMSILPESARDIDVKREKLEGHYSNPIIRFTMTLEGSRAVEFLRRLGEKLDSYDKELLGATLERRYDRKTGRLYLRLGKQEAYLGEIRLVDGDDVVRVVVVFQGTPKLSDIRKFLEEVGLLS